MTHWVHQEVLDRLAQFSRPLAPSRDEGLFERETVERQREAQGLMVCMADRIDEEMLAHFPRLRVVAGVLKGHDNIDVAACARRGVWVTVLADLLTAPTAELVLGLMVSVMRRMREGDALIRSGGFRGWRPRLYGRGLAGATVGLIGMGQLGRAVARRVQAFDARVVYCDRRPEVGRRSTRLERLDLDGLLAVSDVVVPLVPLTADTYHLLDGEALTALRPGTFVVNAGRGSVIDEDAVATALEEGRLGGYAADVFGFEDWCSPDRPHHIPHRLLAHPATVFTPHLGSAVHDVRRRMGLTAAEQIRQALAGQRPDGALTTVPAGSPPRKKG